MNTYPFSLMPPGVCQACTRRACVRCASGHQCAPDVRQACIGVCARRAPGVLRHITNLPSMVKRINGCYSRMLRMALNISWKQKMSNAEVFGSIPMPSVMIANTRVGLAGHITRHEDLRLTSYYSGIHSMVTGDGVGLI